MRRKPRLSTTPEISAERRAAHEAVLAYVSLAAVADALPDQKRARGALVASRKDARRAMHVLEKKQP
jgi:hypothetical protein